MNINNLKMDLWTLVNNIFKMSMNHNDLIYIIHNTTFKIVFIDSFNEI